MDWQKEDYHLERIFPDKDFITGCIEKSNCFFKVAILPELIGKFYSRPSISVSLADEKSSSLQSDGSPEKVYCYCQKSESGQMIGCDNPHCIYEWFHFECLQLKAPPKKKSWYCPECRKLSSF